jgi:photosystem II stability/assembly factor-like uncharacterized protein
VPWLLAASCASLVVASLIAIQDVSSLGSAAALGWRQQHVPSGVFEYEAVSCASSSVCVAVGSQYGTLISATENGGSQWTNQNLPSDLRLHEATLDAISCPSPSTCKAVGQVSRSAALILSTTNGGTTWVRQPAISSATLLAGISCRSAQVCVAVGEDRRGKSVIMGTSSGGTSWSQEATPTAIGLLKDVSCPSVSECVAVGFAGSAPSYSGIVLRTTNGGERWSQQVTSSPGLTGVSCPTELRCVAVGDTPGHSGAILTSTDGGSSWHSRPFPQSSSDLYRVACQSSKSCFTVGVEGSYPKFRGVIDQSTNGGTTWTDVVPPGRVSWLSGLACRGSACVAVGYSGKLGFRSNGSILRHG